MMQLNVVVLFGLMIMPGHATSEDPKETPISKVVKLLQDLMTKIDDDGKAQQKTYDKFACWCEKTLARKAAAIDAGKELIDTTQREIVELKGRLGELGATLKQLEKEIAANEEARKEADQIREKENEDYTAERTEAEQCIGALESAIKVLSGAGTKKAMLETLQEAQLLSVVAGIKGVLRRLPPSEALQESDLNLMKEFAENPTKFVGSQFSAAQMGVDSTNPFGDYAPASTKIQGILKGMYDSFSANLETANAEEADKRKAYEELHATSLQEHATLTATLEAKTKEHADATKDLADNKVLLEETKVQLAADEKFFDETKAGCKAKAAEWAERTRLRTEELHGMEKAVEILEGGAETFGGAFSSAFLQISASKNVVKAKMDKSRSAAYAKLKGLARKHGGLRLAFLAAELGSGGHFDKVIKMIDRMIADLRIEEQEDIKARDRCQLEENKLKNEEEDLDRNIKKKGEEKERLNNAKGEVKDKIEGVEGDITNTNSALDEALDQRNEENDEFKKALKDDVDAVALIEMAIGALTKFYTDNKLPVALVQKEPEYTEDPDKAPDASFGDGSKRKSETGGIIAILSMLKEDLEKEIATARAAEAKDQADYESERSDLTDTLNAQESTKNTLEGEKADLSMKISDTTTEIENHEEMKGNTLDARDALKPSCQWVADHFESRRKNRKAEIDGLQEAKAILAGAEFLQLSSTDSAQFLHRQK